MHSTETEQKNIRGISLSKDHERAFHCIISIDTHDAYKNAHAEIVGLLYTKALISGCKGYTREEFLTAINLIGASVSVNMDNGLVSIAFTSIDTHRDKLMNLVSAMLQSPTFAPKEIARLKELQENELHEEKEDAKSQSMYAFMRSLYGEKDRRFLTKTDTLTALVKTIKKQEIQKFHDKAMSGKWIFTVTSDTESADKIVKKLIKLRASFKEAEEVYGDHEPKELTKRKIELVSIPSKQNIELNIGGLLPISLEDRKYHAFVFGLNVLGKWGGFAGRLMSTVREKEGLTYGIYARVETAGLIEHGYWRIMTFFAPDKVMQGINSTLGQIELIKSKGITVSEFERFKTIIATGQALLNDSVIRTVADTHAYQLKGFTLAGIQDFKKKMLEVTKEEVDAALNEYLDLNKLVISGAGPILASGKALKALGSLVKGSK